MGSRVCVTALFFVFVASCGAKTELDPMIDGHVEMPPIFEAERCNGLDDDGDGLVDEPFRDANGHYVADDHCGGCGRPCGPSGTRVIEAHCTLVDGSPLCAATQCVEGWISTVSGRCVRPHELLCLPCIDDDDCGDVAGARCMDVGGERRCADPCIFGGCPAGYACDAAEALCLPAGGSCSCDAGSSFELACAVPGPSGTFCAGDARCSSGVLSACVAPAEACNEADDDCDGQIDEDFRDVRGAYTVDIHNCGACGVDCTASPLPAGSLVCGGDAFAPSCVLDCLDTHDGIQPGDQVDADRDLATGCECTVHALVDDAGPTFTQGDALDVNCDGADGIVVESYYVASDGDDSWPGSPTRPLRTLAEAMRRVRENVLSGSDRIHVFVAGGTYAEVVELPDGVRLHGGYRRDFLALDPNGFVTEVRAPASAGSPGGAALVVEGPSVRGRRATWIRFVGRDAASPGMPAIGAFLRDVDAGLVLEGLEVRGGVPAIGTNGLRGQSGSSPASGATPGAQPRGAAEDSAHRCIASTTNLVRGGAGGTNVCNGYDVSGGAGGSAHCPTFGSRAADGQPAVGSAITVGGSGGRGGQDSSSPVTGDACPDAPVCCGLADFTVPSEFVTPGPGGNGPNGSAGAPGSGCADPVGWFSAGTWQEGPASNGASGRPGGGGGGGGAGGGTEFAWMPGLCAFADGLGGGGGGGGAGGCGGVFGTAGSSGAPSVAIVIERTVSSGPLPTIRDCLLRTNDGGRGGDGGAGGGGGGGCGGSSIGIWLSGMGETGAPPPMAYSTDNTFVLGRAGPAGRGGGASGSDGIVGRSQDVFAR